MKIRFKVDLQNEIRAGRDTPRVVTVHVDPAKLSEEDRQLLAEAYRIEGDADLGYLTTSNLNMLVSNGPTIEDAFATLWAIKQEREEKKAQEKAKRDEQLATINEKDAKVLKERDVNNGTGRQNWTSSYCYYGAHFTEEELYVRNSPEAKRWEKELEQERARAKAEEERRNEEREAEKKRKAEADREARAAVIKEWAEAHGSARLKTCVTEGIKCDAIYRTERLQLERPGWRYYDETPGDYDEPRNPPAEAFEMLAEARKVSPKAQLKYWKRKETNSFPHVHTQYVALESGYLGEHDIVFGYNGPEYDEDDEY